MKEEEECNVSWRKSSKSVNMSRGRKWPGGGRSRRGDVNRLGPGLRAGAEPGCSPPGAKAATLLLTPDYHKFCFQISFE